MIRHYHRTHPPSLYHSMSTYSIHQQSMIYSHQPVQTNPSLIFINTSIHGKRLRAMLDTGATHSFIIQRTLKQLHRSPTSHFTRQAQLGDGRTTLQIISEVHLPLQFASIITPLKALVVKQMNSDFILGSDWCTQNAVHIDYANNRVSIRSPRGRLFIPYDNAIDYIALDVTTVNVVKIPPRESCIVQAKIELSSADAIYFSPIDATQLDKPIITPPSLLHVNNYTTYLEIYNLHEYTCTLPMNTILGSATHIPYSVDSFILFGPSNCSSSTSVPSTYNLNTITLENPPSQLLTTVDKLLCHLTNTQYKQQLTDKEKTAFVTQDGLWELNVLPQGIMNGPPIFQRIMHNLIGYGRWNYVMFYLDDILIFSRTFDEHKQYLNEILSILHTASFQINPDKCSIAVPEIDFLSHTINERHIKPNAAPLHKFTNKTKSHRHEFFWGPDQQQSFEQFKRILTTSPLFLEYPESSTPFILTTDASDVGIGGILRQETSTGTKINYFKSRILNDTERKYDTFEKEALAIYRCISDLRSYIGDSQFVIETDHKPLENFHTKQINNKRVMNWLFKLQDILPQIIAVKYRKDANNTAADYISRHFPCNNIEIACSPSSNASYNTSPFGSPLWFEKSSKPQGAQIIESDLSHNMLRHDIAVNIQVNAVTTRAQAERLPPSSSITTSSTTPLPPHPSNSPPTDSLLDFSLNRFKSAQDQDSAMQSIIQHIRNNTNKQPFLLHNDLFYKTTSCTS
ncbi:unnamed protein product [Rotaria magnacalcarata]